MKYTSLILILLLSILSCGKKETTAPAPTSGAISGAVMNKAGDAAVPAAIVTTEPPTSSVSTDNAGKYKIEEVDPGDYIVQAVKDGFDPGNVNVTVKAGKTVTADIRMGILLANHPPTKPQLLSPENKSEYQSIDLQLQWKEAADPDGDAVVYDVYFGKENPPPLDMENLDSTQVTKSNLDTATVYYWQVVAKDAKKTSTASDVWQFKTTPNPIPTDGLIAYWPFNGNANDESGNGNDGTVYGATLTTDRFGNENSAYYFDGVNDYINFGNAQTFDLREAITISLWINLNSYMEGALINKWKTQYGCPGSWSLSISESKAKFAVTGDGWDGGYYALSNEVIQLNKYYHILGCFSRTDNKIRIYVNGLEKGQANAQSGSIYVSAAKILVGAQRWYSDGFRESYYNGTIDDIRIYNRILTSEEIQRLFHEKGWQVR